MSLISHRFRRRLTGVSLCTLLLFAATVLTGGLPPAVVAAEAPAGTDAPAATGATPEATPFRFVFLSDTHAGTAAWKATAPGLAAAIGQLAPRPDFLLHGGDLTEMGTADQYESYLAWLAETGLPGYHVPGNHDARWHDAGKAHYQQLFGPPYRSFSYRGVHFILLDSSIDAESHGHLDGPLLTWLRADLERVGRETPVVVMLHHPAGYPPASFMDNADDFYALLRGYRVLGVLTGHGHLDMHWEINDVPVFMVRAAYEGGYLVVDVDPAQGTLRVQSGDLASTMAPVTVSRPAPPRHRLGITVLQPAGPDQWQLVVQADLPAGVVPHWRIGNRKWQPLTTVAGGLWLATVPTADLPPGRHRLQVHATTGSTLPGEPAAADAFAVRNLGPHWSDFHHLTLPAPATGPVQPRWQVQAGGGIQGAPAAAGGMVYAASREGAVFALFGQTGAPAWRYVADGAVVGGVALDGRGQIYVGDAAGFVHALAATSGQRLWRTRVGGPVLSTPVAAAGRILVADMSGRLTALDPATGQALWQYEAGAALRAAPAVGAGLAYAGAWDGSIHAVDVGTGALRWRTPLPGSIYYSPANAQPLYYRGRLYVTRTPPQDGDGLFALDVAGGQILWARQGSFGYSAPILHGGALVVSKTGGDLMAFDPLTGAVQGQAATGLALYDGSVSSFGSDLVAGGLGGEIAGVGGDAQVRWRYRLGDTYVYARPAVDREHIYVGAMDGTLVALTVPPAGGEPAVTPALTVGTPGQPPRVPASGFPDLAGHWADPYVAQARAMGLASGQPDGRFGPDEPITRAQLATMTARWLGLSEPPDGFISGLPDIEGHWAEAAIRALEARGLAGGVPGPAGGIIYDPDAVVNRGQAAALVAKLVGRLGSSAGFASQLTDMQGHWARDPVLALEEIGLISGTVEAGGRLVYGPDQPMTRAQAAALLVRAALPE